ncbi:hypothetical protein HPB50_008905 [Hyalomma asiaticum]|uniref:Uncharacterized protein n=1 Tax=Hyalomma asiaticum TaxID=266040 RepID=A0ACB7SJ78_HYAAI|nr:hypothetical protein HPB50_008905 [Hyalomma asiaticum]
MPPADAGPAPSYASVLAGGQQHPGQQMASRGPDYPAAPPQLAHPSGLSPPFPPFPQPSPELNQHSITARLLKHFSLSPTLWIVIFPLPPRLRQLNIFYMLESLVPKSSAAQGPTPFARLLIALPFGTSTT